MYVGRTADEAGTIEDGFKERELVPRTLQVVQAPDGRPRISSIWGPSSPDGGAAEAARDLFEDTFATICAKRSDEVLIDVAVSHVSHPRSWRERVQAVRDLAETVPGRKPGNLDAMRSRARANLRLVATAKALMHLNFLVGAGQQDGEVLLDRAIAEAVLGRKQDASANRVQSSNHIGRTTPSWSRQRSRRWSWATRSIERSRPST